MSHTDQWQRISDPVDVTGYGHIVRRQFSKPIEIPPPPPLFPRSSRTVGHESSPVVSVISHHHCSFDVLTTPHQDVVDPPSCRSSWLSFSFHHPHHQCLQQSIIRHSTDVADQLEFSLSNDVHHCPLALHSTCHFIVRYVILLSDFQQTSVTSHLECQQPTLIVFLDGPCFHCV